MNEKIIITKDTLFSKKARLIILISGIIIGFFSFAILGECDYWIFFTTLSISLLLLFAYLMLSKIKITVTDKRVFGCVAFGRKVELPLDSISAVAQYNFGYGIAVATSSGKIKFSLIKDSKEVYNEISKLLVNRQANINQTNNDSNLALLKELKELLDIGAITQEEFDQKKKELLNK